MLPSDGLRQIGLEAIRSVHPTNLVRPFVRLRRHDGDDEGQRCVNLDVGETTLKVDTERGCHVVGFGKAVLGMAAELNR